MPPRSAASRVESWFDATLDAAIARATPARRRFILMPLPSFYAFSPPRLPLPPPDAATPRLRARYADATPP